MTNLTPQQVNQAVDKRVKLSEEYARLSDEMATLEQNEAVYFHTRREELKTDKAVQRDWNATEEGLRLIYLKRHVKGVEKEISALNSLIQVANNQARNLY